MDCEKRISVSPKLILAAKLLIAVALCYYLLRFFRVNINSLDWSQVQLPLGHVLLSILLAFAYFGLNAYSWHRLTCILDIDLPLRETFILWMYCQLGKYLPGKVWILVGRAHTYHNRGKSRTLVTTAFVLEMSLRFLAGIVLFLCTWGMYARQAVGAGVMSTCLVAAAALLVLLHPRLLQAAVNVPLRVLKRDQVLFTFRFKDLVQIFALEVLACLIGGLGLYLLIEPTVGMPASHVLLVAGAAAIAGVLGTLAVFVPSGIGVREGILVGLFQAFMPVALAVVVSLLARLWIFFAELMLLLVTFLLWMLPTWWRRT